MVDENGVARVTIKGGSQRAPGSAGPHVELKTSSGQRVNPAGSDKRTGTLRKEPLYHFHLSWTELSPSSLIPFPRHQTGILFIHPVEIHTRTMTTARSQLISVEATPYYHCVSRCVRRSFLCGYDERAQTSYEHRRDWVEKRLKLIAQVFCIDVCAYAIMSNHYHLVLHINTERARLLSDHEVIERWLTLHRAPVLIQRFLKGETSTEAEQKACLTIIQTWRERLCSISWFMRLLNQYIANEANREDGCTGHFWEGRFKSQALLDEKHWPPPWHT